VNDIASQVVICLRNTLGKSEVPLSLHAPHLRGRELEYVGECIRTEWVSSVGLFVDRFEQNLADFTGAKKAVAIVNGTCALHLVLLLAGVKPDEEVIVPALSFVATANAVVHAGAVPHFVDSEVATMGMDPDKLAEHFANLAELREDGCYNRQTGRRIAAVVPMHAFGHPVRLVELLQVTEQYRLPVIEDAAESLGSHYREKHTGVFGRAGVLSFNGNKIITTGGGGAIITNDEALARRAKHVSTTAKRSHPWEFFHDEVGFNYRMPNLNAALGCAQLEHLADFLDRKRRLAERYRVAFAELDEVTFMSEPEGTRSNYWLCTLLLSESAAPCLGRVLQATHNAGFLTRPAWKLLSDLPMFQTQPRGDLSTASNLARRLVSLPSSVTLGG
jgi:perosamine synthetase